VETDLPVEISDWVITMFLLMLFIVCSATIALLLVKIDDIICSFVICLRFAHSIVTVIKDG
jgi:hypothetical protein